MPRNSSGTYTLPAGNPVITNTVITPLWANPTMSDIAQELTNSLDRQGRGGMLAPFKFLDGTIAAPAITWTNEPTSGWYRAGNADFRFSIAGVDKLRVQDTGVTIAVPILGGLQGPLTINAPASGSTLTLAQTDNDDGLVINSNNESRIRLYRATATVGFGLGKLSFHGNDSAAVRQEYANVTSWIQSSVAGAYSGSVKIYTSTAGALRESVVISGASNVTINAPASGYGLATVKATPGNNGLLIDGAAATQTGITIQQAGSSGITLYNPASTNEFRIYSAGADRLIISAAGNVTINAPTSGQALTVNTATGSLYSMDVVAGPAVTDYAIIRLRGSASQAALFGVANAGGQTYSDTVFMGSQSNHSVNFIVADTIRFQMLTSGVLSYNAPAANANYIQWKTAGTTIGYIGAREALAVASPGFTIRAEGILSFCAGSSERMTLDGGGNLNVAGTITGNSDVRLKDNIVGLSNQSSQMAEIKSYRFNWKESGQAGIGFIAQEVEKVYPELVLTNDETGMKSVNYMGVTVVHHVELVEQRSILNDLTRRVETLEAA